MLQTLLLVTLTRPLPWDVELGPLVVTAGGLHLEPRLEIGGRVGHVRAKAGFGDLRNGVSFGVGANVEETFTTTAANLTGLVSNLRAQNRLSDKLLIPMVNVLGTVSREVVRLVHVNISEPDEIERVDGELVIKSGIGTSSAAAFGWSDTEGYHMIGAGGQVMSALGVGFSLFVGMRGKDSVKVVIIMPNIGLKLKLHRRWPNHDKSDSVVTQWVEFVNE